MSLHRQSLMLSTKHVDSPSASESRARHDTLSREDNMMAMNLAPDDFTLNTRHSIDGHEHDNDNENVDYFESFANNNNSPQSFSSGHDSASPRHEGCMRRVLQILFLICAIFFIAPLIFFIAGSTQIIPQYANVSMAVQTGDDSHIKKAPNFPSVSEICSAGDDSHFYCIRFIFFLVYMVIFLLMFVCCISLFALRKQRNPLKSRSCIFITIFCVALAINMVWACVGLLYAPGWLGCDGSHVLINLWYPCLILPYFFRAYRMKKIYDQATRNAFGKDLNMFRSAQTQSMLSTHLNIVAPNNLRSDLRSQRSHSVHSLASNVNENSSFNFEDALDFGHKLDKRLLCAFLLCLFPFMLLCILGRYPGAHHRLPTFIKSCPDYRPTSAIVFWVAIHAFEILLLILMVYWIRAIWRAFSVRQELMIVAVIDMVFCACMIGFNPTSSSVDDGVLRLYLVLVRGVGLFAITILLPLYQTFLRESILEIPTQDVITSLSAILEDMDAMCYFRQFVDEQDCVHLLDFWMEVDLFRDACYHDELEDVYGEAYKIFCKYLDVENASRGAQHIRSILDSKEVNGVGDKPVEKRKRTFVKAINKVFDDRHREKVGIHPNIFDYPHRLLFEYMETTHYRLFLRSTHCKQLLTSVAGQEEIFRKLINQEIL